MEEELKHHYMIAVSIHPATSSKAGKPFMKYRPIHWTNKDRDNLEEALILRDSSDMFPSGIKESEALAVYDLGELVHSLGSLSKAGVANQCTFHHFESESEIEEEWFDFLVESSQDIKSNKKLLEGSRRRM